MARRTITTTNAWQLASATACIITVQDGKGAIDFNESASDSDKLSLVANPGGQFNTADVKETWVKSETEGITLIVVDSE